MADQGNTDGHCEHSSSSGINSCDDMSDVQLEEEYIEVMASDDDETHYLRKMPEDCSDREQKQSVLDDQPNRDDTCLGSATKNLATSEQKSAEIETEELQKTMSKQVNDQKTSVWESDHTDYQTVGGNTGDTEAFRKAEQGFESKSYETNVAEHDDDDDDDLDGCGDDVSSPWVFFVDSYRFRDKIQKQFAGRPMSLKRSRQEISAAQRQHHVAVYPVSLDVMNDPELLQIFDLCTEVQTDFHNIYIDGTHKMKGYLQLWFKDANDISQHLAFLHQLGDSSTQIYCESSTNHLSYAEFRETWRGKYQGTLQTTMFIPFLPKEVEESDLWTVFPMATLIAVNHDANTCFRYAYIVFSNDETLKMAIDMANMQNKPKTLKKLHLVPIKTLFDDKEDLVTANHNDTDQQTSKKIITWSERTSCLQKSERKKSKVKPFKTTIPQSATFRKRKPFHAPKSKPIPRSVQHASKSGDTEEYFSLASFLRALRTETPDVISTLAEALQMTDLQQTSSEESLVEVPLAVAVSQQPMKGNRRGHRQKYYQSKQNHDDDQWFHDHEKQVQEHHSETYGKPVKQKEKRQQQKSMNSNKQQDIVRPKVYGRDQRLPRSSDNQLPDTHSRSLPACYQEKRKYKPRKIHYTNPRQRCNQHTVHEDEMPSEYHHSWPNPSRGRTYSELVDAHNFTQSVESSDEYKTWVSKNRKDSRRKKGVKYQVQ